MPALAAATDTFVCFGADIYIYNCSVTAIVFHCFLAGVAAAAKRCQRVRPLDFCIRLGRSSWVAAVGVLPFYVSLMFASVGCT